NAEPMELFPLETGTEAVRLRRNLLDEPRPISAVIVVPHTRVSVPEYQPGTEQLRNHPSNVETRLARVDNRTVRIAHDTTVEPRPNGRTALDYTRVVEHPHNV